MIDGAVPRGIDYEVRRGQEGWAASVGLLLENGEAAAVEAHGGFVAAEDRAVKIEK